MFEMIFASALLAAICALPILLIKLLLNLMRGMKLINQTSSIMAERDLPHSKPIHGRVMHPPQCKVRIEYGYKQATGRVEHIVKGVNRVPV